MAIKFSVLDKKRAVLIEIDGAVDIEQAQQMRRRSVELVEETGFKDFVVDMRRLESLEHGKTSAIVDLANDFKDHEFTVWSNTAVLMPVDKRAFEQVELLHVIEVNRGRGVISYVETMDEAFSWFEEMAHRISAPATSQHGVSSA